MMVQLSKAGKLQSLAGLLVGQFTEMKDNETPFGADAQEIIYSHVKDFNYPVAFNFPVGHGMFNRAISVGRTAVFQCTNDSVTLSYQEAGD